MSDDTQLVKVSRADAPDEGSAAALLLRCNEDSSLADLHAASDAVDALYEAAKELKRHRDELFIERIRQHGGFTLNTTRYFLSHPKTVKCRNVLTTVRRVLEAVGGDEDAFGRCLSSNALKVGQCRSLLGGDFDAHFETVVRDKLETGEAAPKELAAVDERFLK